MAAVCGAAERPAEIVAKNGLPTIQINRAAKDFKVGKMVPGEGLTTYFAKTNAAGEVTEVSSAPATRTVGDIFTSRVGMRYVPGDGEVLGKGARRGATARAPSPHGGGATAGARPAAVSLRSAVSPHGGEILREIPEAEISPRLKGWERPRFVVLEAETLEVRGVFSISDELPNREAAHEFFDKTLLKELTGFFGADQKIYPLGGNEFALRHRDERGNELEMRIKGFAADGGHIRYIIYHGRPYAPVDEPGVMNGRFDSVYRSFRMH